MHLTAREISRRLADQGESVCRVLLPGGKPVRGEWVCGDVDGSEGDSLKVHLSGENAGKWRDWANQEQHGDLLDLWCITRGVSLPDAIKGAREFLGLAELFERPKRVYTLPKSNGVHPVDINGRVMQYLVHKRGLEPAIINRYKVAGKPESNAIVFPCFSIDGTLINRSYRTLPKEGEDKKVWQDSGCAPCLFGWQVLPKEAFETRTVLLSEGQIDCMTWAQWGIPALSIPNGGGMTWIDYEWDNLAAFDNIRIAFDTDEAGQKMAQDAMARLGRHRCLMVSMPRKDANDCLLSGSTAEDAKQWVDSATPPSIEGLIAAKDMKQGLLNEMTPKERAFTLPFFHIEWPYVGLYFRPGEVTIWSGHPGQGKSTILRFMAMVLMADRRSVFCASMESKPTRELFKMFVLQTGGRPTEERVDEFLSEIGEYLLFADCLGFIKRKTLMEMLWFGFQRYGITHFIIDSLMRVDDLEENYIEQSKFLTELQDFAKRTDSHIHLVAHPRKTQDGNKPAKMDLKGSSGIFAATDNMVVVSRNQKKDKLRKEGKPVADWERMHDTEITVEKQRDSGWEGSYFLKFDTRTFCYSKCDPPKDDETEKKPRRVSQFPSP